MERSNNNINKGIDKKVLMVFTKVRTLNKGSLIKVITTLKINGYTR